jgi:hypothetical protein
MLDADTGPSPAQVRLEERIRRVVALLESRFDYLPSVPSTMPVTSSGPADDSKYVPCEPCKGRGRVVYKRTGRRLDRICLACDGTGQRRRRKDDPAFDGYVGRTRPTGSKPRSMTAREYADTISRLQADADTREGKTQHERYGWERARQHRDQAGSYVELDHAVMELRQRMPGEPVTSTVGLLFIQSRMGPTIRLPGALHASLAEERKAVIQALAFRWNWTAGEIGRVLGVSRDRVRLVLKAVRPT